EEDRNIIYSLEMRYGMQVHTVRIRIPRKEYTAADLEEVSQIFDQVYESLYGKGSGYSPAGRFVVSFIVEGFGRLPTPSRPKREEIGRDASQALAGTRQAFFSGNGGFVPTNIYRYERLQPGNAVAGPAIVEGAQTTVVVPPGFNAQIDGHLNIRISMPGR
ncbi:MAG: hypothetical protein Q8P59_04160, partial [Dehalococcoidia bacterium]|nr:hypothetical protein [Dehalococcoidia bacterium]